MGLLLFKRKESREICDCEPANKMRKIEEPHSKKGFLLILNHEFFDDKTLLRPGTRQDVENLVKTFTKFNFEIEIFHDLSFKQIKELTEKCKVLHFMCC